MHTTWTKKRATYSRRDLQQQQNISLIQRLQLTATSLCYLQWPCCAVLSFQLISGHHESECSGANHQTARNVWASCRLWTPVLGSLALGCGRTRPHPRWLISVGPLYRAGLTGTFQPQMCVARACRSPSRACVKEAKEAKGPGCGRHCDPVKLRPTAAAQGSSTPERK